MPTLRFSYIISLLICVAIVLSITACATPSLSNSASGSTARAGQSGNGGGSSTNTPSGQVAPFLTNCPATGTARIAIMPALPTGSQQAVIYLANAQNAASLDSYTIASGQTHTLASFADTSISAAQVSHDGQWILFVAITNNQARLQLIRVDGHDLQTLYCATPVSNGADATSIIQNIEWSSNQQLVAFASYTSSSGVVDLLNMQTGALQTVFSSGNGFIYPPITWQDNTHLFLRAPTIDGPSTALYLLDINNGSNQRFADLQAVYQNSSLLPCWDADSSYDGTRLFISQCTSRPRTSGPGIDGYQGPGSISVEPLTSGSSSTPQTIYSMNAAITQVRVISQNTLLFLVENSSMSQSIDTSQNGLWKIGVDGSQPTQLMSDGAGVSGGPSTLCSFTQYPWSNVSRDGSMYAIQHSSKHGTVQTLLFGSLNGGSPTTFATSSDGTQLAVVGWTTI
jgi:hypothetical protein